MTVGAAQHITFGSFLKPNGDLYPYIKVYHYAAGTLNDKSIWGDADKTIPSAQPFISDSSGIARFFADGVYKFVIHDQDGNLLYTWDNYKVTADEWPVWEEDFGTAYPSASAANKHHTFLKTDSNGNVIEDGRSTGSSYIPIRPFVIANPNDIIGSDAIATAQGRLLLLCSAINLPSGNITLSADIWPVRGGVISKGSATSLTITGPVVCDPMHQWLSGFSAGDVIFGTKVKAVMPEWLGASEENADSTTAIQTAIQSHGIVKLNAMYTVQRLTIPDYKLLYGSGYNTGFKLKDSANVSMIGQSNETTPAQYVRLFNFRLNGNGANQSAGTYHGIALRASRNCEYDSLWIHDTKGGDCIIITESSDNDEPQYNKIINCNIWNFGRNGIAITAGIRTIIDKCIIKTARAEANPGACIDIEPNTPNTVSQVSISNTVCESGKTVGGGSGEGLLIFGYGAVTNIRGVEITNCFFLNNQGSGFRSYYATEIMVSNCFSSGNSIHGFHLDNSTTQSIIQGCRAVSNTQYGFRETANSDYNDFIGNRNIGNGTNTVLIAGTNSRYYANDGTFETTQFGTTTPIIIDDDSFMEGIENGDPSAPATNKWRLYGRDNGSGKTQLCVRFSTGAIQVIATEP